MNILFVRLSYIGDILHATPAAKALKERYPEAKLHWICTPSLGPLLEGNPYVDEVIPWERDLYEAHSKKLHLRTMYRMYKELRQKLKPYHFDMAVDVQGRLISGLVLMASGAPRRLGLSGTKELNWLFTNEKAKGHYDHVIKRYNDVVALTGADVSDTHMVLNLFPQEIEWARNELAVLEEAKPTIGLVFGTSWASKEWTEGHWHSLLNSIYPWANILLLGGDRERELTDRIIHDVPLEAINTYDAVGQTNLRETAALINECQLLITGDTGALHMAEALDVPSIGIFGPTDPAIWGSLSDTSLSLVASGVDCLGCRKRTCPRGDHLCMAALAPETVERAIRRLLKMETMEAPVSE